jgi:hypothetical protein
MPACPVMAGGLIWFLRDHQGKPIPSPAQWRVHALGLPAMQGLH